MLATYPIAEAADMIFWAQEKRQDEELYETWLHSMSDKPYAKWKEDVLAEAKRKAESLIPVSVEEEQRRYARDAAYIRIKQK